MIYHTTKLRTCRPGANLPRADHLERSPDPSFVPTQKIWPCLLKRAGTCMETSSGQEISFSLNKSIINYWCCTVLWGKCWNHISNKNKTGKYVCAYVCWGTPCNDFRRKNGEEATKVQTDQICSFKPTSVCIILQLSIKICRDNWWTFRFCRYIRIFWRQSLQFRKPFGVLVKHWESLRNHDPLVMFFLNGTTKFWG